MVRLIDLGHRPYHHDESQIAYFSWRFALTGSYDVFHLHWPEWFLGPDLGRHRAGQSRFRGVRRRMQHRGSEAGVMVYDDFAHHPTAIEETLAGVRSAHPSRKIWAIFEPRSATSCTSRTTSSLSAAQSKSCPLPCSINSPKAGVWWRWYRKAGVLVRRGFTRRSAGPSLVGRCSMPPRVSAGATPPACQRVAACVIWIGCRWKSIHSGWPTSARSGGVDSKARRRAPT